VLTDQQKIRMKKVARSPYHHELGKDNEHLEDTLKVIKLESPKEFLTESDLSERRFFHKPLTVIPFKSFTKEKL